MLSVFQISVFSVSRNELQMFKETTRFSFRLPAVAGSVILIEAALAAQRPI
jgi:hypothetical protein